ncbi:MAG: DUF2785 domain-containing protein [Defluviitaleaceae bacterium]|nr:DUF2785 domain-containing protein [Defluviitaleaceae bacterium]
MYIKKMMEDWKNELYEEFDLQPAIDEIGTRKLLDMFLDNIGNTESYVRENVLEAIGMLICGMSVLSPDDYLHALSTSLSETHLFNGIGGAENDAAFCRAFSSFIVAQVIHVDGRQCFLSHAQYLEVLDKATEYMILEKDRRGFIYGGKGIVHAIPHGTSMLMTLIEHPKFPKEYTIRVLDSIKCNIVGKGRFAADDWADRSLAETIAVLLNKGISEDIIKEWIETLLPPIDAGIGKYTDEHYPYIQMGSDIEHFLMYVYFDLKKKSIFDGLGEWIFEYFAKLWKKVYLHIP